MCLIGSSVTVVKAKVEGNIPKKRGAAAAGYDKALSRFFDKVNCPIRSVMVSTVTRLRSCYPGRICRTNFCCCRL